MKVKGFMKKTLVLAVGTIMLLGGCGTYTGGGAFVGATLGSMIGSAVGGISEGFRGSDIGSLVGMAGGAVVGGAIGAQADKAHQERVAQEQDSFDWRYMQRREAATSGSYVDGNYRYQDTAGYNMADDGSGFDPTGSGDGTLYDFNSTDYTGDYTATEPEHITPAVRYDEINALSKTPSLPLDVRNARFVDDNQDGWLNPDELCKLIFEVYNTSSETVLDVQPMVVETTGNKQIAISGTVHVEEISQGKGIRYTAIVKAGKRLRGRSAVFRVYAVRGSNNVISNVMEFDIPVSEK